MLFTYLLLIIDVFLAASAQLLLKKLMSSFGSFELQWQALGSLFLFLIRNLYFWSTVVCYGLAFVCWLYVLSRIKLSVAYSSLSGVYILIILGSLFFFKEAIAPVQFLGIALILVGLFFLFQIK
ncbi:MAG: SMR family transporter [Candidatus Komeilibacteria bacterium]